MVAAKVVCLKISTISVSKGNMLSSWKLESSNFVSCDFSPQTSSPLFPNQGRKTIIRASKQSKADGQYSDDFGSEWMKLEGFNSEVSSSWTDSVMESSLRHRIEELSTSGQEPVPDPPSLECEEEKATIEDMHQVLSDKEAFRLVDECFQHVTSAFDRMETNLSALEVLDKRQAFDLMDEDTLVRLLTAAEESIQYLKVAYTRVQLNKSNPLNREIVRKVNARFLERSTNWHMTYSGWERRVAKIRNRVQCSTSEGCL